MNDTISALIDDELSHSQALQTLDDLLLDTAQGRERRRHYSEYCLIGDALRGYSLPSRSLTDQVVSQLENEPTLLSPRGDRKEWSTLALAASVACMAVTLGVVFKQEAQPQPNLLAEPLTPAKLALALNASVDQGKDANNDMVDYMFAHQSYSQASYAASTANQIRTISMVLGGEE
jgi:negative regulator of sigma E activity